MSPGDQVFSQLRVVVDLAVGHELDRVVLTGERLLATRDVDDRQPAHAKPDAGQRHRPLVVRPAMPQRVDHPTEVIACDRPYRVTFDDAGDTAHMCWRETALAACRLRRKSNDGTMAAS